MIQIHDTRSREDLAFLAPIFLASFALIFKLIRRSFFSSRQWTSYYFSRFFQKRKKGKLRRINFRDRPYPRANRGCSALLKRKKRRKQRWLTGRRVMKKRQGWRWEEKRVIQVGHIHIHYENTGLEHIRSHSRVLETNREPTPVNR